MKPIKLFIILISIIMGMSTCKKLCKCKDPSNPDCKNYDPYYGKQLPTANFTIRQSMRPLGWEDIPENTPEFSDTIIVGNSGVLFTATESNAKYEWTIGDDQRKFYTKEVALNFYNYIQNGNNLNKKIPIKLRVVKVPPKPFNEKDSVYVMERNLVFSNKQLCEGTFEGYFDNDPNVKRTIKIDFKLYKFKVPPYTFAAQPDSLELEGYAYSGLPNLPTLFVSIDHIIERCCRTNFFSYKQWKWAIDKQDRIATNGLDAMSSGLMGFHAYAEFSEDGRHPITVIYTYRKSRTSNEEIFVFRGIKKI